MTGSKLLQTIILLISATSFIAGAQPPTTPPSQTKIPTDTEIPLTPPDLSGEVLKVSGEYRLRIINNDPTRKFQGLATISLGNSAQQFEAVKVKISLAPGESAIHLLYSMPAMGDQYTLMVTDLSGSVVIYKIAPVKTVTDPSLIAPPPQPVSTVPIKSEIRSQLKVKPRLAGGASENDPYVLAFELSNPTPVNNAQLIVKAKGLNETRPVNFSGTTNIDFKLSDEMEVQNISYKVIGSTGEVLASGEADIAQLMMADVVNVGAMKLDKPAYKAGEAAKLTVELAGNTPNGVRVEVTAKDATGKPIYRDIRKEKKETGLPSLDFTIAIPKDAKDLIVVEIKVFDADTNTLLDTANKELPVGVN